MSQPILYCERCHKPLGPELLPCPERDVGTCSYQLLSSYPDLAPDLHVQIYKAIESCIDTD